MPKRRICIVTDDIVGPIRNGGIGTACYALATTLARAGHEVTILYTRGSFSENLPIRSCVSFYKRRGVRFLSLPKPSFPIHSLWHSSLAYQVYLWAKKSSFDFLYFPAARGLGYYCLLAKKQGLCFENTILCVEMHAPTLWRKLENREFSNELADFEADFLERRCVAMADVLFSGCRFMLEHIQSMGWQLPSHCFIQPRILPDSADGLKHAESGPPQTIVFFGRLETRKGLELFCDAIEALPKVMLKGRNVVFLGKPGTILSPGSAPGTFVQGNGAQYLQRRSTQWDFNWDILADHDRHQALRFLRKTDCVAVIPSLADMASYTVLECLAYKIPLLASRVGGIPELVARRCHDAVLFHPTAETLTQRLREVLNTGLSPAEPAINFEENNKRWASWFSSFPIRPTPKLRRLKRTPRVSVCLIHRNRPEFLRQAVASLKRQTYPNFEVVLVDDNSDLPSVKATLRELTASFAPRRWKVVTLTERHYPGGARNIAARHARGAYLLFMDDDDIAKPKEIETFVRVALRSRSDILTCAMDAFKGRTPPKIKTLPHHRLAHLGPAASIGAFVNCYGGISALVRRGAFQALGGFGAEPGIGNEDWEFLAKAVLGGFRLDTIPESLYWYRLSPKGYNKRTQGFMNELRPLGPYLSQIPQHLRPLLHLSASALKNNLGRIVQDHSEIKEDLDTKLQFKRSEVRLLHLDKEFTDVTPVHHLEMRTGSHGLMLKAVGNDPNFLLPPFKFPKKTPVLIYIKMTSPKGTQLQIFFKTRKEDHYCERNSLKKPIHKGINHIYFKIPNRGLKDRLRIDPGMIPGAFILHDVELRAVSTHASVAKAGA